MSVSWLHEMIAKRLQKLLALDVANLTAELKEKF